MRTDGRTDGLKNKGLHSKAQQIFLVEERVLKHRDRSIFTCHKWVFEAILPA